MGYYFVEGVEGGEISGALNFPLRLCIIFLVGNSLCKNFLTSKIKIRIT